MYKNLIFVKVIEFLVKHITMFAKMAFIPLYHPEVFIISFLYKWSYHTMISFFGIIIFGKIEIFILEWTRLRNIGKKHDFRLFLHEQFEF